MRSHRRGRKSPPNFKLAKESVRVPKSSSGRVELDWAAPYRNEQPEAATYM